MLNKLYQRVAIEISFLRNKNTPPYFIDPLVRSLSKKYDDIDIYLDFLISTRKKLSVPTQVPFNLWEKIRFGSNYKTIERKLLSPLAEYSGNGLLKTDILLYDYTYRGFPSRIEFHFYENKLFYIECNLGDLASRDRIELLEEIKGLYNIIELETELQKISDPAGNVLSVENGTELKIFLAQTGNPFFTEISNIEIFYNKKQSSDKGGKAIYQPTSQNKVFEDIKKTG
ncbi:MAG: hypothetical protein K0B37_01220 [Bacteroidales bacterium]|nr:hypothetical protein [Bacteroidales bacterium]